MVDMDTLLIIFFAAGNFEFPVRSHFHVIGFLTTGFFILIVFPFFIFLIIHLLTLLTPGVQF
jgi:hypothetical protein